MADPARVRPAFGHSPPPGTLGLADGNVASDGAQDDANLASLSLRHLCFEDRPAIRQRSVRAGVEQQGQAAGINSGSAHQQHLVDRLWTPAGAVG